LRVAADLIEQGRAVAATNGGTARECTNETGAGMNEPGQAAGISPVVGANRTNEMPAHLSNGTNEPDDLTATQPLNRHQRRRLAALARRELRHAA
jgi:hypothetical protein